MLSLFFRKAGSPSRVLLHATRPPLSRCLATGAAKSDSKTRIDKSLLPPRRPLTNFSRFIMEHSAQVLNDQGEGAGNIFSKLSLKWSTLSASEKSKYAVPPKEWEAYRTALESWKQTVDLDTLTAINQDRVSRNLKPIITAANAPLKKPSGPFSVFLQELYAEGGVEDRRPVAMSKKAAERWGAMSDEEKQPYKDRQQAQWKEYHKSVSVKSNAAPKV